MATISINAATQTIQAVLTAAEFAIAQSALSTPDGTNALESMFSSFIQAQQQAIQAQQRQMIRQSIDTLAAPKLSQMVAILQSP